MNEAPGVPANDALPTNTLLRINEVAAETGVTTRTIRYYEELGLLAPAGRSEGDYRLYDESDLERIKFIRSLRDDAGFSLAQIGQLIEDDAARARNRERLRQTTDPAERRVFLLEAEERAARQVALLTEKAARLASMVADAEARLARIRTRIEELDAGVTDASAASPSSVAAGAGPATQAVRAGATGTPTR